MSSSGRKRNTVAGKRSGTKRSVPSSELSQELHQTTRAGGAEAAVHPGQAESLPLVQPPVGHAGKRRAVLIPPPAKGGNVGYVDLTGDSENEEEGVGGRQVAGHEQGDEEQEDEHEEEEEEEEVEDSYVYHYDTDGSDGEAGGGICMAKPAANPQRAEWLGVRIADSFAEAASDLPDLHPLELHFSPSHSPTFTVSLLLDGVAYSIRFIPCLSEPSRLDRAVVSTSDPAAPFPGFMTRLLGAFLPHLMEAADEGVLRERIGECMNALYVESLKMLKTEKASTASQEQQAVDCERILSLLGPLVRYQSPALRLLHATTFLLRQYERFCYLCGRVHDLPADAETQEALLAERAKEANVSVSSLGRAHVCGAELCAHTATEALGLMAPAMETRINGGTVTEFFLDAVSNAGRSGKMHLFSYVPPDYVKPGDQDGKGRGDIDGPKLLAGFCDLRRLNYTKMKECLDAKPTDDEDPGPEGLEKRFRGLFDALFVDARDPYKPERIYKLYWWLCVCYKSHLREVPLSYVTDYFTKIRPVAAAHQAQLGPMLTQVQEACSARNMVVLELVNDRRPKRRAFEAKRRSVLGSEARGGSWIAFHGSRPENWHSLLQTGVQVLSNTAHMLNGAAYGTGVYTSNMFNTSLGYSMGCGLGWSQSSSNEQAPPVAIVEVVCDAALKPANITAVPDGDGVCIKFIVVKRHVAAEPVKKEE